MLNRVGTKLCGVALAVFLSLVAGGPLWAAQGTWATDAAVGASEVDVTIGISCPAVGFICDLIDGYGDTRTSTVTGSGTVEVDEMLDELQFDADGQQDVGAGLQDAFVTLAGTPLSFTSIPFAGVPEIENLLVFALSNPPISVSGLVLLTPGDYPFSETVDYGSLADVVGDLELDVPDIVIAAQPTTVTGTLRVLGDIDSDDFVEYEILDYTASITLMGPGNIGGESVDITVTSDLVANLSGEVAAPVPVPVLGLAGRIALMLAFASASILLGRRRV